jgi:hypothetical protein
VTTGFLLLSNFLKSFKVAIDYPRAENFTDADKSKQTSGRKKGTS